MSQAVRIASALLLCGGVSGCALITAPAKVVGTATSTAIKTTGTIVAAPFKMAGNSGNED